MSCGHLHLDVRSLNTVKRHVATSIWMFTHSMQLNLSCGHLYLDVCSLNTVKPVLLPPPFRYSLTQYSKTCLVATSIWMFPRSIQSKLSCGHLYLDVRFHQYSKTISCGHLHLDVRSLSTVNLPGGHLYLDVRSLNTAKPVLWPPLFGCSLTQYSKICLVATSFWMFPHSIQ